MIIHLFVPFFGGSHRRWAEGYAQHSGHQVRLFTLPGRHWKWRMHGAAVALARQYMAQPEQPDLILTTDMLDTAAFLAFTRRRTAGIPVAVYFHENQLTYPWSPTDADVPQQRDRHYAWINYTSALAADAVLFNSAYHRDSFLGALPAFLGAFPDFGSPDTVADIATRAHVLHLGMDLAAFVPAPTPPTPPVLLWNHRWEYDKNPEAFFRVCRRLQAAGADFRLVVLGQQYGQVPAVFEAARTALAAHILHWGFAADAADYVGWLRRAHILPVTNVQDFFGGSVVEAIHCGVYPLLPDRLAYREHLPPDLHAQHLYSDEDMLYEKLLALLANPSACASTAATRTWVHRYDWSEQAERYDALLVGMFDV